MVPVRVVPAVVHRDVEVDDVIGQYADDVDVHRLPGEVSHLRGDEAHVHVRVSLRLQYPHRQPSNLNGNNKYIILTCVRY